MSELQRLLAAYDTQRMLGKACALATVVEVNGSAYRRPGARMLVTNEGQLTGTISGGCLEGDARRRAQQVMHRGMPEIVIYDSTDLEDDLENGAQLGCQGQIFILLEPIDHADANNPMELLRRAIQLQQKCVLATVLKSGGDAIAAIASRVLLLTDGEINSTAVSNTFFDGYLRDDMIEVLENGISEVRDYEFAGTSARIFLEVIKPAPILSIYGAGNDAQPLVQLATRLGWRVNVIDGRPNLVSERRFPQTEHLQIARLEELKQYVIPQGFAVLMSHNYFYDMAVLEQLNDRPEVEYIGILGPHKKTKLILADLSLKNIDVGELDKRIYSPIGLDIGGENADEIALSIMAELQAVRNGFKGGSLRDIKAPIHNRDLNIKLLANG